MGGGIGNGERERRERRTVDDDDIAFADALFAEHTGEDFNFVEELGVGVCLDSVCDGRVPYYGRVVAVAGEDVAVDAVVGCGDLAIGEPGPMVMVDATREGFLAAGQDS